MIRDTARRLKRTGLWSVYGSALGLASRTESGELESCLAAFVAGENLSPLRAAPKDCLPRSLALYRFLLACGIPVQHVIAVQSHPFSGHAWVEKDGLALLESKPPHHRPIARMSPAG